MDAKCRWCFDQLDGAVSFRESLGQTKVMQIRQGETLNHQGAITHEVCCLAAQWAKFRVQILLIDAECTANILVIWNTDIHHDSFLLVIFTTNNTTKPWSNGRLAGLTTTT